MTLSEAVVRGSLVLPKAMLQEHELHRIRAQLTVTSRAYKDFPATTVRAYEEDRLTFHLPRHFQTEALWPKVGQWNWVAPTLYHDLKQRMVLDATRGQPAAADAMERHLRSASGGILIAPTGTGKTLISMEIARRFKTPIGVLVYAEHMVDNWVRHAEEHLGLHIEDVGFVREDQCDLGKPLTIMSVQSLLARRYPTDLYEQIGFLIADEVHRFGAAQWHKTVALFPARYRLGMSADPERKDGLEEIVYWTFGRAAYRLHRKVKAKATVCVFRYPATYTDRSYCTFVRDTDGRWVPSDPDPLRYDKLLASDTKRNQWITQQVVEARLKGRAILVFAKLRHHCETLYQMFDAEKQADQRLKGTNAALLLGGPVTKKGKQQRSNALKADVMFATYGYAKDAMDAVQLDTLVFASPPGNPLQPIGRLRDINADEKKPMLVIDVYEPNDYSEHRLDRRESLYRSLGHPIRRFGKETR